MSSRIAELEARLAAVEQRLAVLEGGAPEAVAQAREDAAPSLTGDGFAAQASTRIGRVLLIFGGAYLLRAITEYQFVPTAVGLFLGAVYAVVWLVMAYRKSGIEGARADAEFYGGTSVLLILPLLYEAATTFALLSGVQGMIAIGLYCASAFLVATVRKLRVLAWLVSGGAIGISAGMLVATHAVVAVAIFLLLMGLVTLWAVYLRDWIGLQWLGAFGAR